MPPARVGPAKSEYVEEGSFGCVFRPAPAPALYRKSCTGAVTGKVATVSKFLLDAEEADVEVSNHESIDRRDPDHIFTVRMLRVCRNVPVSSLSLTASEMDKCSHLAHASSNDTVTEIVYEDGGDDLDVLLSRFAMSPRTANKLLHERNMHLLLSRFEGLLYGLAKMKLSRFIHFDIYPPNVVILGDRARLIDFGLAQAMDGSVYHPSRFKHLEKNFLHVNPYYPPEYKLVYLLNMHGTDQLSFAKYKELLLTLHPAYGTLQRMGVPVEKLMTQARQSFHALLSSPDPVAEIAKHDDVIDTFGVGMIIAKVLTKASSVGLPLAADLRELVLRMVHYDPGARIKPDAAYLRYCGVMLRHGAQPRYLGTYIGHARRVDPERADRRVLERMAVLLDLPKGTSKKELAAIISSRLRTTKSAPPPVTS